MRKWMFLLLVLVLAAACAAADGMKTVTLSDEGPTELPDGVLFENSRLSITKPGEYLLSGSLADGQIFVDCAEQGKVILYLNGLSVHCETSSAILIGKCDPRLVISLVDQTENTLSSGEKLIYTEDDEPNGVIFSHSDLTVEGDGLLTVTAGAMDGIVSKDDLKITGGTISVTAARHGIRGKDSVEISGGDIKITAERDGIKSTAKNNPDRGFVAISGGTVTITCKDEAIQAVTGCFISNATVSFCQAP